MRGQLGEARLWRYVAYKSTLLSTLAAMRPNGAAMNDKPVKAPEDCHNMLDVRAGVDSIDAQLVALLKTRFGYMDAAARIKDTRESVRDETRKAQVLDNVREFARSAGLPDGLTDKLWEELVESSIAYEFDEWDQQRSS